MSKIKEIHSRLQKNPAEYNALRFLVAKQVFSLAFFLYFLSYLFTVGGFYFEPFFSLDNLAASRYHLYSLLIIATVFFWYSLTEHISHMLFQGNKIFPILGFVIGSVLGAAALASHLGLIGNHLF